MRALGFGAASWHLPDLALCEEPGLLRGVRNRLADAELHLVQLLPPDHPSLCHPDRESRLAGVAAMGRSLDAAAEVGAANLYVRPGSLNSAGPWTPHPKNHCPETRGRLVESLRSICRMAADAGVTLALEGHVLSPVHTPEILRELLTEVDSPWLRVNLDPVNFVGSVDDAFEPAGITETLLRLVGDSVVAVHVKDVVVGNRLVVHIEETVPGRGHLDLGHLLRRCREVCPDAPLIIEHLPAGDLPEARQAVESAAARERICLV